MSVVVVAHRSSGGVDEQEVDAVARALSPLGEVRQAWVGRDPAEIVAAVAAGDLVVVAGGDGAMNHAVNALGGRLADVVLGLVPMGTGNDLARTLSLPTADARAAAGALVQGSERRLDLGRASSGGVERLFLNACMGGFPVAMNKAIDEDLKKRLGQVAFWVGGAKAAVQLERTHVAMNGIEQDHCVAVGVGNGRTAGGGIEIWPSALPDDGVLNGCALGAANRAAAARLAARLGTGSHEELDAVATTRARRITIESEPAIELNVDGELVDLTTPAVLEIVGTVVMRG
jgi:diacylglycerol kinase (ATP)